MSGLPGSGKSTLADVLGERLGTTVLSVDPIEAAIWRAGIPPSFETGVAAYEVGAEIAGHQLRLGLSVIADAVNSLEVGRAAWRRVAQAARAEIRVIHVVCGDRELHRTRLGSRRRSIEGFQEPTWEDVDRRRIEFEPWPEPTLVLDSVHAVECNISTALDYLALSASPRE